MHTVNPSVVHLYTQVAITSIWSAREVLLQRKVGGWIGDHPLGERSHVLQENKGGFICLCVTYEFLNQTTTERRHKNADKVLVFLFIYFQSLC